MATTLMDVLPVFEKQLNPFEPFLTAWVGLCMLRDRAKESCSRWSGAVRLIHWSFDDPADVTESANNGDKYSGESATRLLPPFASSWPQFRHDPPCSDTPVIRERQIRVDLIVTVLPSNGEQPSDGADKVLAQPASNSRLTIHLLYKFCRSTGIRRRYGEEAQESLTGEGYVSAENTQKTGSRFSCSL
jgi:hypothetical protein